MDRLFNFDYKKYREMTEAADDHRNSTPPEEYRENHSAGYNMHPLLESLPRRNPTQVHADSSVHRMRAAAPTSETHTDYSKILELIGAYGDGEDMRGLNRRFHLISPDHQPPVAGSAPRWVDAAVT
ncbi:hypothetical protein LYZ89_16110 [Xanthomonas hortorum pv. vitians]|uniref:hypothetical protein n=1 Tax=Xanthomonas hortorum TaxID=56454 RepID=UPI0012FDB2B7|nr:hypothetical protein [Xanthomonas hortorum]MCE4308058.1 hypothetical protein [Xanthomonas hortorum pv. vitians]MCE4338562.1 hypothetical protein [Xanthomonas hortorum pv. vitians]MCE4509090.1 hypothetical protein [Xanthomonas hortorum pv. vitians]WJM78538.1 hypothetical protein QTJ10_11005 [Xanthomonas hortorum pv. vitians]